MDPEQIPLRDIHLPDPIGWWPLAPGWWFLIALIVAGLIYFLYRRVLKWRHNAARRLALHELKRLRQAYEAGEDALVLSKSLSELMRRSMLAYAPRDEVAGLTGEAWLRWLDRGLDGEPFSAGAGRSLESLPYRRPERMEQETDIRGLFDAVAKRLRTPLPEANG